MQSGSSQNGGVSREATPVGRRRSPWPLAVVAALFIIVPFIFWYGTWFGRPLKDEEIDQYLTDETKPRHMQHALVQLAERIARGDESARRWHPQIRKVASSDVADVRMTAAWVMGEEHTSEDFRDALLRLLEDPEPSVCRNAALALVRYGDARCRPELRAMLQPFTVVSRTEGTALAALTDGSFVKRDAMLVRLKKGDSSVEEVRSPLPGKISQALVKENDQVQIGRDLFQLAPDADSVWESLRALYLIGTGDELAEVERYAQGVEGMPDRVRQQALLTAEAIKRRGAQ
ncbi:MAG TPA: HEAT repeat domain-containing protein [Pyrinomonadaceae bacterium]|nr:HEAT repeat domain-containing protein [Pyrinomonadaceae bacterium]